MNTEKMIDVTGCKLTDLVKAAYDLSSPQGLGFLHHEEGTLTDEQADSMINEEGQIAVSMDYVKGRACKMTVFRDGEKLFIRDTWYDHTENQLMRLLDMVAV